MQKLDYLLNRIPIYSVFSLDIQSISNIKEIFGIKITLEIKTRAKEEEH